MKTEKEILEEIENCKKKRDIFVVDDMEWFIMDIEVKRLEWVLEI